MRSKRLSFVAGWAAVALLAIAGFAAFGTSDGGSEDLETNVIAASIGHTSGAYAGLSFALVGDGETAAVAVADEPVTEEAENPAPEPSEATETEEASYGTIASPVSGWLSEVEVRSLVEKYFEPTDVNRAVRIAWCESRFDPNAVDMQTGSVGLFGHLPRYWEERAGNAGFPGVPATDPEASTAAAAWEVYNGVGWEVFSCR
ncbi:MAG: hypothetical protein ACLFRT_00485 [Actinomycetota bacterium]